MKRISKRGLKKLLLIIPVLLVLVFGLGSVSAESLIPEWIQNTALWYGQGTITDQEYIESIKYLIDNKIIFLDEEEKEDVIDPTIASENVIVTKPRINQCSVLYQAYKNVGQSQFLAKYDHVNFIETCVKLYKDSVWQYQGEDRVDKINGKDPDFIVYAEFSNQEALDAYKAHPLYKKSISIVRPLRDMRIAADFLG